MAPDGLREPVGRQRRFPGWLPKWRPKRSPGPPGRVKSRWEISPEAPWKIAMNFFAAPGVSGSVLGASRGGSWGPLGAQQGPGAFQEPFWHPKWCQNGAPRPHVWSCFDTLELYFGHLRPSLFQASRLCWCSAFAFGCSPSVSFRPVLSARWPVLGRMPL